MSIEVVDQGVAAALRHLADDLDDLDRAWQQIGGRAVDAATPVVPVLSGALVDSLTAEAEPAGVVVRAGGPAVPYAGVIDRGWAARNIAPAHFMDRAEEAIEDHAADDLADEVQRAIDRLGLG